VTGDLERDWAQVGVLFANTPSGRTPDLERLLLDTARACADNTRLFPLVVTWLVSYGRFVARHRLKRLVLDELEPEFQAVLGLIIDEAVENGATRDLRIISDVCRPLATPRPLAAAQRKGALARIARRTASALSRRWGVWAPPAALRHEAVRPVTWLLHHNPEYRERIVRKGDLRASVLETLRRDTADGSLPSESALSRLSGATRTAVRKALAALQLEGMVTVGVDPSNDRDHPVHLRAISEGTR